MESVLSQKVNKYGEMKKYPLPSKEKHQRILAERNRKLEELNFLRPKKRSKKYNSVAHQLEFNSIDDPRTGCRIWTLTLNNVGYGFVSFTDEDGIAHKNELAHRQAYEQFRGPIEDGKDVAHTCDTPYCIAPNHLWLATPKENSQDCVRKGRDNAAAKPHVGRTKGSKNKAPMTAEARANIGRGRREYWAQIRSEKDNGTETTH
jgi:HNH endonuclease